MAKKSKNKVHKVDKYQLLYLQQTYSLMNQKLEELFEQIRKDCGAPEGWVFSFAEEGFVKPEPKLLESD